MPWFRLPILGWSLPLPAWNRAGLFCLVLAGALLTRAFAGAGSRWFVRIALLPAAYFWWHSQAAVKSWGASHLAPAQLKLASANQALAGLGFEGVTLYEPALWRTLQPETGWYVSGVTMLFILCLTSLDGGSGVVCPRCQAKGRAGDPFCHGCGHRLASEPICRNCGYRPDIGDAFCRGCGEKL